MTVTTATMNEAEYREWWKLHRRAAVGETLSDVERTAYEAGLAQLHAEKTLFVSPERLQAMEERIAALEAERERMATEQDALLARIDALKAERQRTLVTAER